MKGDGTGTARRQIHKIIKTVLTLFKNANANQNRIFIVVGFNAWYLRYFLT